MEAAPHDTATREVHSYATQFQASFLSANVQYLKRVTSVRVLVEQIQLISRKCLNVIGDDVVK